jgi:hypothetical protein
MFADFMLPGRIPYDRWLELDHCYIDDCDVILRMPGDSKGADQECIHAEAHNIPVLHGLGNFLAEYKDCYGKVPA